MQKKIEELKQNIKDIEVIMRVNNLLLSRFILQLSEVRKELGLPKRNVFFKFELLQTDYEELVDQYGKQEVDKVLYRLDRAMILNKQNCPHNIKKFVANKLKRKARNNEAES